MGKFYAMKTLITCILSLVGHFLTAQIQTTNTITNDNLTIFILPQNVAATGKIISYGPPNPKVKGRSILVIFPEGPNYIIKTKESGDEESKSETIVELHKMLDGVSTLLNHELDFKVGPSKLDKKNDWCRINGFLDSGEEWDLSFDIYKKHDLKNSYFLDFIDENNYEVVLDMKQK